MSEELKDDILKELQKVNYPGYSRDIVSFGIIKNLRIEGKELFIDVSTSTNDEKVVEKIYVDMNQCLEDKFDFEKINIDMKNISPKTPAMEVSKIKGVKYVIAVASGKGGVGKSTFSVNLAASLSNYGRVGICDCDLYGPSISKMLGGGNQMPSGNENNEIVPITLHGIQSMSMGYLLQDDSPVIVRAPIANKYILQFLNQVAWDNLDYLVLDLPPGTGDIHLTVSQHVKLDGAVIITTPQEISLIDAKKASTMFKKVNVDVLGVVENMSYFICPDCDSSDREKKRHYIFGKDGGKNEAKRLGVPFLGEIPLFEKIREFSDSGTPFVFSSDDKKHFELKKCFFEIAEKISTRVKSV